ncbi:hypothetical protein [Microbacterium sp. NPDC057650]|uniref:hypothetical protein n=1 Tax=unclassified Microbacterium TaxID=2609290 RepID=UPI00366AC4A7
MTTRIAALAATLTATALCATVLVGCTAVEPTAAEPSYIVEVSAAPKPSAAPTAAETDPDACASKAMVQLGGSRANISGNPVDRGPRELAAGTVGRDDAGTIVSYTVAAGDAPAAIGERLCISGADALATMNHTRTIHPGQVLRLNQESAPWVPYYNPAEAEAGFQQIPYQEAIEAMGRAADASKVDTMRAIWREKLKAMFTDPAVIDEIQKALDSGDLVVLDQMFS